MATISTPGLSAVLDFHLICLVCGTQGTIAALRYSYFSIEQKFHIVFRKIHKLNEINRWLTARTQYLILVMLL